MDHSGDILQIQNEVLKICTNIIGIRDEYTQGHSHHVYAVTKAIVAAGAFPLDSRKLEQAALLHDIGKILVPDSILNKEGALDDVQWAEMRRHPSYGKQLLQDTLFDEVTEWILYHHERIDGRGYYGLPEKDIPLASRIIAVADTFSALRTYRAYRGAKSIRETTAIMNDAAGTQLDADVLEVLLSYGEGFLEQLECNCEICKRRRAAEQNRLLV